MKIQNNSYCIAICDDEQQALRKIMDMATDILHEENILPEISCYESGMTLLDAMKNGRNFDLILLDVVMPQQDGMALAKCLRGGIYDHSIVFVSSNREMAMQGYEVSAVRYLAKPIERERLREALLYCFKLRQKQREILLPVSGGMQKILPKDIKYIEVQGRGCRVVQEHGTLSTSMRISELEPLLKDQGFIRCHQSFLANLRYIRIVRSNELEFFNGTVIPVSKYRIQTVREAFFSYLES